MLKLHRELLALALASATMPMVALAPLSNAACVPPKTVSEYRYWAKTPSTGVPNTWTSKSMVWEATAPEKWPMLCHCTIRTPSISCQ
jgi:hypothetical protein